VNLAADALTASRAFLAVGLAVMVAQGRLGWAAVVLSLAWITDVADGRLARAAREPTRLGDWDFRADVAVGAGVLAGLIIHGYVPRPPATALFALLVGGFVVLRSAALGMSLQAVAYAALGWRLWVDSVGSGWIPFLVAGMIGVIEWRRLFAEQIPVFLNGWGRALLLRRGVDYRFPRRGQGPERRSP
jgi:phosphatidylglycerophosphate synthase